MPLHWSDSTDGLDWEELSALYRAAPLGNKSAASLRASFGASRYCCLVREDGRLVGAGRALADGIDCSYLCDIAVMPSHQGTGLGKAIVARLVELSAGHRKILLYAVPGKEAFYAKAGFRRMRTAMAIFADPAQAAQQGYVDETLEPTLSAEDRQTLTRLEEAMWRAATRYDTDFQQAHFAADFIEFGRSGRTYRRGDAISHESHPIDAVIPLPGLAIRLLDRNTAQLTYDSQVRNGEVVEFARRSSIWSRTPGGWVMRFHQGTPYTP